jgi:putative (di)nucleoside polyphosphate hydrolase
MSQVIDTDGFREGVGIILLNERGRLFWARRVRPYNAWQFPQGGLMPGEKPLDGMYRELHEETGLLDDDVELLAETKDWYKYYLPKQMVRRDSEPLCIGQKQKWYLLRLTAEETHIDFQATETPEFNSYRWVHYWYPLKHVIPFKRRVYRQALKAFAGVVFPERDLTRDEIIEASDSSIG